MRIRIASGPVKLYMRMMGFVGYTALWKTIYLMPGFEDEPWLLKHEKQHIAQMERDGVLIYAFKSLMWKALVGSYDSPYEVEARASER